MFQPDGIEDLYSCVNNCYKLTLRLCDKITQSCLIEAAQSTNGGGGQQRGLRRILQGLSVSSGKALNWPRHTQVHISG